VLSARLLPKDKNGVCFEIQMSNGLIYTLIPLESSDDEPINILEDLLSGMLVWKEPKE
jgi:hypothetical protein